MRKVDEFYDNSKLSEIFATATNNGTTEDPVYLFSQIYVPVRDYDTTNQKLSDTYTYYNVGITVDEMADLYWSEFSAMYLLGAGLGKDIDEDTDKLKVRCTSIFKKYLGKYKKLVELEGLIWNPLWNVDGVELRQLLETHGNETHLSTGSSHTVDGNYSQRQHKSAPYDSDTFKNEWQETDQGQGGSGTASASSGIVGGVEIEAESGTVGNITGSTGTASTDLRSVQHDSISYGVSAGDAAFGSAVEDGDILHTEKHIRQGNIGVTKTSELIEDARKVVRFSIIEEFFKDINEIILCPIFNFDYEDIPWWSSGSSTSHPDTGRTSSVINSAFDLIQSIELDEYGHVIGISSNDGVTRMSTPLTQQEYEDTDPKDLPLYYVYDN